ncbi:hypothetical protein F4805DRAFT_454213 [Annulohypoxylon moriforme]|nr:hypothetical protein F4805DRAFT_454213 [Annulohypoxylon moriforme]
MDKLPQEIYDRIVSFIERRIDDPNVPAEERRGRDLAIYPAVASVSRKFQAAVERLTFRVLHVTATESELNKLERSLTPQRCDYLRFLALCIVFPGHTERPLIQYERDDTRRANNESATQTLRRIFDILAVAYNRDNHTEPTLNLEISAPNTPRNLPSKGNIGQLQQEWRRSVFSLLDITGDAADFPNLPAVRTFALTNSFRSWDPRVALLLSTKVVNAIFTEWDRTYRTSFWGRYYRFDELYRNSLVNNIRSTPLPASVRVFSCKLPQVQVHNALHLPNFIGTENYDPVCCALRHYTRNCTHVRLEGPIHASLFDPPANVLGGDASCWNNLTELLVKVTMYGPDGVWLFKRWDGYDTPGSPPGTPTDHYRLPPGYGETEEELEEAERYLDNHSDAFFGSGSEHGPYRTIPNDTAMNALLTSFARGCSRLPSLKEAILTAVFDHPENSPVQVSCAASNHSFATWDEEFAEGTDTWRVFLYLNWWRPDEATVEEFKKIGRNKDGHDSQICYLPWGEYIE